MPVTRPNQVWRTEITYIRRARGFACRVAIIDGYSRKVLSGRISNRMEAVFCVDCREDALRHHGKPALFNSDQGSPFTREAFTGVLTRNGIALRMEGRGRADARPDGILCFLQWRAATPVLGPQDARCRLSNGHRGQRRPAVS